MKRPTRRTLTVVIAMLAIAFGTFVMWMGVARESYYNPRPGYVSGFHISVDNCPHYARRTRNM